MFKRCAYYFMIGMFGLGYVYMNSGYGANAGLFVGFWLTAGQIMFYVASFLFLIELIIGIARYLKE